MAVFLLYPHQLFAPRYLPRFVEAVWLVEEPLFFYDPLQAPAFHRQKLILHRATMRYMADWLETEGYAVRYWTYHEVAREGTARAADLILQAANRQGLAEIHLFEPVDYLLERRLARAAARQGITLHFHPTPAFLTSRAENAAFQAGQQRYHQTTYYIWQRQRLKVLLDKNGKPVGGRWTYDTENRQRLPAGHRPPPLQLAEPNPYVEEAIAYIAQHFPTAWGASGPWWLPTTHAAAQAWLKAFLQERLYHFGPYEDAFEPDEPFLYHSVLSPLLNIGLLTPHEVLTETLNYAQTHDVPLPSLEGFIRQLIGWREYIRLVYDQIGTRLRKSNHWNHTQDFPSGWEEAQTGLAPVDTVLRRLYRWGYTHHIERLMVLGSFLFLHEVHPDKIYAFFMRSYVDAYDWVMVPNVYGMSQHASHLITTKPYFCGSRYLLSLSHFPRGKWADAWDESFWEWVRRHRTELASYPRLRPLLRNPKAQAS